MNIVWKGAAALTLTIASLGAISAPAQAQYHGSGWRSDQYRVDYRRGDYRRDYRRDDRRHWRGDRGYYRSHWRGNRVRCWTEWRYDRYRDRRVRARICR